MYSEEWFFKRNTLSRAVDSYQGTTSVVPYVAEDVIGFSR
jgi:hypothetical protein